MASSAMSCWRSCRCRAAADSCFTKRSSAVRCREITSVRWRRAWSTDCCAARSVSPVIDVQVTLTDGSYHSVDSSDQRSVPRRGSGSAKRCRSASRCCWNRSMWWRSSVPPTPPRRSTPSCPGRRGQILGFDTREGWTGWDRVRAMMPEAEIGDLIVELRSATAGAGSFHPAVRPHGRSHRPRRRPDHCRASRRGVSVAAITILGPRVVIIGNSGSGKRSAR